MAIAPPQVPSQPHFGMCHAMRKQLGFFHCTVEIGKMLFLSEQQLADCDRSDSGCNGGFPSIAFQFMIDQGMGLEGESVYPYTAADG